MRLGLFSLCLPVVQNLTLCPPEVPSVRDLLPTSFFAVKKNTFLGKNKHNKDKKVRVFYCLRISMRTKHKSTVLLFSCPISYSNMYWFEFAVSLPKKQSPFYQRLPNISQNCQTKLNTYTHTLSLSLSKLRQRSHGFSFSSDLTLFFARCIGSQHEAKEDPPSQCRTLPLPHRSPICQYTSLFLLFFH